MYQNATFLAIIPARSGSKGLPDKNIKPLCGKPLLAWSIEAALDSAYIDEVVVSTDSALYANIAKDYGANVPFLRPESLSGDKASTFDVLKHCVDYYQYNLNKSFDYIVLLEPTSPLREKNTKSHKGDVDKAIEVLLEQGADSLSSIGEVKEHPAILKRISHNRLESFLNTLPKTTRRQDNEPLYFPYGVAYIAKTSALLEQKTFYTSNCAFYLIKPYQCYEIDDICDFLCIEAMMKHFYAPDSAPPAHTTQNTAQTQHHITQKENTMPTQQTYDIKHKILIIGLGSMGKRRVRNLIALGLKEQILGFDVREDRRKEAESKYQIPTFESLESALNSHKIGIFINSTPPHIHIQYTQIAARLGIHCFVEASVVHKDEILALSQNKKQESIILPSSTMYHTPLVQTIKKLVEAQAIGKILNINYHTGQYLPSWHPWEDISEYYVSRQDTGGGREIVPFELTWLCKIFGKAEALSGVYSKLTDMHAPIDDMYHCLLRFESGIMLNLSVQVIANPKAVRDLKILGSEGLISYNQEANILSYINTTMSDWEHYSFEKGTIEAQYINPEEPYIEEMRSFLNAIVSHNPALFPNSLQEDYEILSLLESIEAKSLHLDSTFNGGGAELNDSYPRITIPSRAALHSSRTALVCAPLRPSQSAAMAKVA